MRYIVTPQFSQKLATLPSSAFPKVKSALSRIGDLTKDQLITDPAVFTLAAGTGLFAYRADDVRLFLTFGTDASGEYVLVADVAGSESLEPSNLNRVVGFSPRNPKTNGLLNPKINGLINPNFNGQINPNFNGQINPNFNGQINPNFNGQINPNFNGQINPNFNGQINPNFNSSLNPRFNWSIDPRRSSGLNTLFVYDLKANPTGFVVRANDQFMLIFDDNSEWKQFAVAHPNDGFVVFDRSGIWTEHWESNHHDGYNRFGLDNSWIGFAI
jgi:hypothetical protein